MINPFKEIDWQPSEEKRRQFGRVLALIFAAIAGGLALLRSARELPLIDPILLAVVGGAFLGLLCWLLPRSALPFYVAWHAVGATVGIILSNLLLAATYYFVLTPIAVILRLADRDPLRRRFDAQRKTYWEPAETGVDPEQYYRQF